MWGKLPEAQVWGENSLMRFFRIYSVGRQNRVKCKAGHVMGAGAHHI